MLDLFRVFERGEDVVRKILVETLLHNSGKWMKAAELASVCECTTRTIRNHVAKMNKETANFIISSDKGYQINLAQYPAYLNAKSAEELTKRNRAIYIIRELLENSGEGVDIFDLAEQLYISESTLKTDIQQLKKELAKSNLLVKTLGDVFFLKGSEQAKRKFMISVLYEEGSAQNDLKKNIQEMIGHISLLDLETDIKETALEYGLKMNQYSLNNLVMHFAITIERISGGYILKNRLSTALKRDALEYQIAKKITRKLEKKYAILFSEGEIEQLSIMFVGLRQEGELNTSSIHQFVDEKIILILKEVIQKVEETYLIKFDNEDFLNKLALHVQNLYERSKVNNYTRNSSLLDIKMSYPLIYDISVFISSHITEQLDIGLNDDEISFIALHIGAYFEAELNNKAELQVILISYEYPEIVKQLHKKIEKLYVDEIEITSNTDQIEVGKPHFIITTDRNILIKHPGAVLVHPFLTKKDEEKIRHRVTAIKKFQHQEKMFRYIDKYFDEALFFGQIDPTSYTKEGIIKQLVSKMALQNYVDLDFKSLVLEREEMSPTSFPSGAAVPHAMKMVAQKSCVGVMTLQEPIKWAKQEVHLIFLIAISKPDVSEFNDFLEKIVELISEKRYVRELTKTETFENFILKLKMLSEHAFNEM